MVSRTRTTAARVRIGSANVGKLKKTIATAAKTAIQGSELTLVAGRVIARRSALGAAAMLDPANGDYAEFSRIVPEKTAAFSASGMALFCWASEIAWRVARVTSDEAAKMTRASTELALCRTPAAAVAVQTSFAVGWCGRAYSQLLAASALAIRSHGAMLAPLHRAATSNDRRLNL
jgi:hypothetical protein